MIKIIQKSAHTGSYLLEVDEVSFLEMSNRISDVTASKLEQSMRNRLIAEFLPDIEKKIRKSIKELNKKEVMDILFKEALKKEFIIKLGKNEK